jgi:hypothetical protein
MNNRLLAVLAVALGLMNPIAAITAAIEKMPNCEPVFLALFVIPWLVGAELLRRNKVVVGGVLVALLSLLDIVSAPGWRRDSAADWVEQILAAGGAVVCLTVAVTLIARRYRSPLSAAQVRS